MMKNREKVRSIFISDIHLGCRYCKAEELLIFLRNIDVQNLYLVGDILDGWKLKKGFYWDDNCSFLLKRIIGMMKHDAKIIYLAGNHDEFLRKFLPACFGHLQFEDEYIHECLDGRKLLVIHGDIFDTVTLKFPWLYYLGDKSYTIAMWLNDNLNFVRRLFGFKYWSFSAYLKNNVKQAVSFINNFEFFLANYTKQKNCDGVICGHIHNPTIKNLDGIMYYNCGDWVESCSVVIEHEDGTFELRYV